MSVGLLLVLVLTGRASPASSGRLTPTYGHIGAVAWSPDAREISWTQQVRNTTTARIWVADASGANRRPVSGRIDALDQIAWLRSGDIIYAADFQLYRLSLRTHRSIPLGPLSGGVFALDRSQSLVATGSPGCPLCRAPISLIQLRSNSRSNVGSANESDGDPSFAPDGRELVYDHSQCLPHGGECDLGPVTLREATVGGHVIRTLARGLCPLWSPDGRSITYVGGDAPGVDQLRLIPAQGGRSRLLVQTGSCDRSFPNAWSPDGRFIATYGRLFRLSIVNVAQRRLRQTSLTLSGGFAWSPDAKSLLVSASDPHTKGCTSLWLVTPDGTPKQVLGC